MTAVYLETSALVTWAYSQEGWDRVHREIEAADELVASTVTALEARRVVARGEAIGAVDAATSRAVAGRLSKILDRVTEMDVTADVRDRCARAFPVEPVRALDAVHLATALEFAGVFPDLRVLTFDRRVRENAEALGLDVV